METPTVVVLSEALIVTLLAVDRWFHGITGPRSLESKVNESVDDITSIKLDIEKINDKASEVNSSINAKINNIQLDIRELQIKIKFLGGR